MKKVTLILGALVMGFLLSSCGESTKDKIYKDVDAFFVQKEAEIQGIDNADALLDFVTEMDNYPELDLIDKYVDAEGNITGLTEEEGDVLSDMMIQRREVYTDIETAKCNEMMEPLIVEYENIIASLYEDFEAGLSEASEDKMAQWESIYTQIDHYTTIIPNELYDRFREADDTFDYMFGLGDYAEADE